MPHTGRCGVGHTVFVVVGGGVFETFVKEYVTQREGGLRENG